jgi:hypothetical protein
LLIILYITENINDEEAYLRKWARMLDPKQWPEVTIHFTFGETEIRSLSARLGLIEREMVQSLQE